ncbi:MAG TPA: ferredoxin [Pseudorhodoferax sp.]|jgi:NAD-dependent dihydropyrimidine dehydrogenase PreA subunit|nr:ferredoxin [Pseudorhodoferax sp.]
MPHVITDACIDVKDGACVACCPVDCIYEGERTLYIHPDACIDCGICVSACPTQAIYEASRLPAHLADYVAINREFFSAEVSGLGDPGGAADVGPVACDHPAVVAAAKSAGAAR